MTTKKTKQTLAYLENLCGKLTFGSFLSAIRESDSISQVAFAKQLGISRQYLCDIEHDRRLVSPKMAETYAKKLGYPPQQFIRLCLQDLINREGIKFIIELKAA